ncbi:type II toxin-antitoxin system VapC family toxin [Spirosoma sp.]|uniref:type II toxin-antitoxin system VapC family toxin n=1 Tax=Spirosoma sp. TaxID=1899569 RepID=UPI003B3BC065
MKYLLDTHILIWTLTDNPKLSSSVKTILVDETNEFFFSTESIRDRAGVPDDFESKDG